MIIRLLLTVDLSQTSIFHMFQYHYLGLDDWVCRMQIKQISRWHPNYGSVYNIMNIIYTNIGKTKTNLGTFILEHGSKIMADVIY